MSPSMVRATAPIRRAPSQWLDGNQVQYEFKDLDESPELNGYVADLNGGKRVMPTIQIDNEVLINPSEKELEQAVQQATAERP